jgi:hypothetical protein
MSVPHCVSAAPTGATRKNVLSPARQHLIALLNDVQFGRIQALVIRDGEPVFDPPPAIVRTLKLGGAGNPHPLVGDPAQRPAFAELFAHFTRIGNGVIHKIQVADGLPLLAEVEEHPRV